MAGIIVMSYVTPIERECGYLCERIYEDAEYLVNDSAFDQVIVNGNAQTGLLTKGDTIFVVHQGTNEGRDWFSNIDTGVLYTPAGLKCREGFYLHARKTWRGVRHFIEASGAQKIIFTGHSLGGASATIQAQLCFEKYAELQNTTHLITFGAPRCLSPSGAHRISQNFEGKITRFVSKGDLVPSVPTSVLWRHTDGLAYISGGKVYREEKRPIQSWFRSTGNLFRGIFTLAKQHSMERYNKKLLSVMVYDAPIKESPTKGYEVFSA